MVFFEQAHHLAGSLFVGDYGEARGSPKAVEKAVQGRVAFQRPGKGDNIPIQEIGCNARDLPV